MIRIRIVYGENKELLGFHMRGHAGYAENGYDIICSAVSSLALNMINSIDQFTDTGYRYETSDDGGLLKFRYMEEPGHDSILLFRSLILGLENIVKEYGDEYLSITYLQKVGKHKYILTKNQEV